MASTNPVLSGRLANMGFMKKAAGKAAAAAADRQAYHDSRPAPAGKHTTAPQQQQEHHTQQQQHYHHQQQQQQQQRQQQQQHQQQQQAVEQSHAVHEAVDAQQQQQQQQIDSKQKYSLSNRLTNMKFMQRGQQVKRGFDEAIGQDNAAKQEAEWVFASSSSSSSSSKGCVVIQERDPLPAGILGRMSFGKFNPAIEQLQDDAEAAALGKPLPSQQQQQADGVSVTDDDMAKGWGKHAGVLKSLRMERTAKRPRRH